MFREGSVIQRLAYYSDLFMAAGIYLFSLRVKLAPPGKLMRLALPGKTTAPGESREKIEKYVRFCLFLQSKTGVRHTCLTSSVVLCNYLRRNGINANIVLSCKKDDEAMRGHAWVETGERITNEGWHNITRYPDGP
ncbi:MAG: lasso peptide biosynthesis B2 protein [Candidatus Omnitrophica bacterium]|nr:lasso peptide biosynthesis B2 protein [Candidatus Omnitrophota bacterium]